MIPETVKIMGLEYQVCEVLEINDEPGNMGDILYHKLLIRLKEGLAGERKVQTLLHEILHACFYEAGYQEQDEEMISRVSAVLYQVLRENPVLLCGKEVG